ncbi:alpha/beta hydrolase [Solimonas variicoloris]|uniref:alpha/beta hydrolase n=1 Tax=Solimonas variicoloris TaxID=254408 RepID=UPI00039AD3F4|nr:alpha/beta hydrolase [Solimonas variicoloris]
MASISRACRAFAILVLACGAGPAVAAAGAAPTLIPLWPDAVLADAPVRGPERVGRDGKGTGAISNIRTPRLELYRPATPNGTAVLIAGGGGYFRIQIGNEAVPTAKWLAALGVTAAVLYYRLPADGWPASAPFADAQRAMRILRSRAGELGIDPRQIGVLGMSAGGHLAAITETRYADAFHEPLDAIDQVSARPDFAALIFPVISLQAPLDTTRSKRELSTQKDAVEAYSAEMHVSHDTPPTFLAHAADDPIADVGHSLAMFNALHAASVPAELHVFEAGGHGWGLGAPSTLVAQWPRLFATWARSHGFMSGTGYAVPLPAPARAQHNDDRSAPRDE